MFKRIQLRAKPIQAVFRRNLVDAEIHVPRRIEYIKMNTNAPSASLGNGIKGQKIFPSGTLIKNIARELPKAAEALFAITAMMILWPKAIVKLSHLVNSIPADTTAAAKVTLNGETSVDIPQTFAHLSKPVEDDE